jgi:hypothetical protein
MFDTTPAAKPATTTLDVLMVMLRSPFNGQ